MKEMMMMMMSGYWSYGTDADADDNDDENHDDQTTCRWSQHVSAAVHRSAGLFIARMSINNPLTSYKITSHFTFLIACSPAVLLGEAALTVGGVCPCVYVCLSVCVCVWSETLLGR